MGNTQTLYSFSWHQKIAIVKHDCTFGHGIVVAVAVAVAVVDVAIVALAAAVVDAVVAINNTNFLLLVKLLLAVFIYGQLCKPVEVIVAIDWCFGW